MTVGGGPGAPTARTPRVAARIRRRVTETVDRELTEKEIWFVATGSEEVGTLGMQALLRDVTARDNDAVVPKN